MLFKSRNEFETSAFLVCRIKECKDEAEKLWSTETNVVDVCKNHYDQLIKERE